MKAKILILISLTVLFSACSTAYKIRKENKKYKKTTTSLRYKSYKKLSAKSIPLFLEQYNDSIEWKNVKENDVRVYVGLVMLLAQQNRFAAAEAEMILASGDTGLNQYSALNILASVKQQKGWVHIAKIDFERAAECDIKSVEIDSMDFGDFASELVLANINIRNGDFVASTNNFAKLGTATGVNWPAYITVILSELKDGDASSAAVHYAEFQEDKDVPDKVKEWFAKEYILFSKHPEQLNNLSSFSKNMFKLFLTGGFTLGTAKTLKTIVEETGNIALMLIGGAK